jgi:hypothetical protein
MSEFPQSSETSITSAQSTITPPTPEKRPKRRAALAIYVALLFITAA